MAGQGISVIIPAHNGARFYADAIASVRAQNRRDLDIVVIDDGSTDSLPEVIQNSGVQVRYLAQMQKGPAAARNAGLRSTSCDLVAFLDVDDIWAAGHLDRLVAVLGEDPEAGLAQGLVRQFIVLPDGRRMLSGAYRMPYLGSCVFRRSVFLRCGFFNEAMQMGEDYDLLFRCWEKDVPKQTVEDVSLLYRRHQGNMTRGKNPAANVAVVRSRIQRIRSGAINPSVPRRFVFDRYMGDVRNFADTQMEMPGQWNLSSAS